MALASYQGKTVNIPASTQMSSPARQSTPAAPKQSTPWVPTPNTSFGGVSYSGMQSNVAPKSSGSVLGVATSAPSSSGGGNGGGGQSAPQNNGGGQKANFVDTSGNESYNPDVPSLDDQANWIFQDLDKRLADQDTYKKSMTDQLGTAVAGQNAQAADAKTAGINDLNSNATAEVDRSSGTLREMSNNANDLLARLSQMFGGGSAAEAAMSGASRQINQTRGGVLTARDQVLSQIDSKKTAIDQTYQSELGKIKNWSDGKLQEIGSQIQGWVNEIANAKTEVRAQLSAKAVDTARNYLTQLALNQDAYKKSVDQWQMQRNAELDDYKTKLGITAQVTPGKYDASIKLPGSGTTIDNGATATPTVNATKSSLLGSKATSPFDSLTNLSIG